MEAVNQSGGKIWWLRESAGILFKLYPVVFMALGWFNTAETFLVLVISYQMMAYMSMGRSTFIVWYDFVKVRFPKLSSGERVEKIVVYGVSWFLSTMFLWWLFRFVFGMLEAPVYRQEFEHVMTYGHMMDADTFNRYFYLGRHSAVLERTLWINGCWFFIMEAIQLVRLIKNYSLKDHRYGNSLYWGMNQYATRKQKKLKVAWIALFAGFYIWMLIAGENGYAIVSFFVFDIGFLLLNRRSSIPKAKPEPEPVMVLIEPEPAAELIVSTDPLPTTGRRNRGKRKKK